MKKQLIGNLLLLFTALIWGTAFVFQRIGMDSIEPISFNAARMALAAVFIGVLADIHHAVGLIVEPGCPFKGFGADVID